MYDEEKVYVTCIFHHLASACILNFNLVPNNQANNPEHNITKQNKIKFN